MTATYGRTSVRTGTLVGVHSLPVQVEVDVCSGLPSFNIVGLPDAAVQEARERVRSAIRASGCEMPNARIVINLAPGPVRKHGTGFDLPIAMGVLAATGQLDPGILGHCFVVGELGLDGRIRSVPGLLAHGLCAEQLGLTLLSAPHAALLPAERCIHADSLAKVLRGEWRSSRDDLAAPAPQEPHVDFSEVRGQDLAVRVLQVAAAGGLNVLLIGPPGAGKTLLARRVPTILPGLSDTERLETALVHSVSGLDEGPALSGVRPFRAPHHSASVAGLVGGGVPPRPGEASLAHNGVLFLDEVAEFGPAALQCLRQPMEDGAVTLVRAEGRVVFPARFSLIAASNPCPCGYSGDPDRACTCTPSVVERYRRRLGGPLTDRIDIVCSVSRPSPRSMMHAEAAPASARLRADVEQAVAFRQRAGTGRVSGLSGAALLAACRLGPLAREVEDLASHHHLSGRGITRLLRTARAIADLERSDTVLPEHLDEAFAYRGEELR